MSKVITIDLYEYEQLVKDAKRYRWFREQDWYESKICAVAFPKTAVKPGNDCPSRTRLDDLIDVEIGQ